MSGSARRRRLIVLVALSVLAGGCETPLPTSSASIPDPSVGGVTNTTRPALEEVPCPADVAPQVVDPAALTCLSLTVQEDRSKADGPTIHLFVMRVDPPGGATANDPVILLGHLAAQDGYGGMTAAGQRTHRRLYLIDPRGIGHSTPSLDCPEVADVSASLAGLGNRDPQRRTTLLGAVRACADRLVTAGVDLEAYDLAANAADLEDLRLALGVPQWNVLTNGSASRVAFELAQRDPGGIRTLMIDSPSLPEPNFLTVGPELLDDVLDRLRTACDAQPGCAALTPDLAQAIDDAAARLENAPVTLEVDGTVAAAKVGHPVPVVVDGVALLRWIRASIAGVGGAAAHEIAPTVQRSLQGKLSASDSIAMALSSDVGDCLGMLPNCELLNLGALYSVVCRDIGPSIDHRRVDAAVGGRAAEAHLFGDSPLLVPCAGWPVAAAPPGPSGPPTGGVPSLILRGAFDAFSAPSAALATADAGVANAFLVQVPNEGYNVLGYNECPVAIRNAWIDAPTAAPADVSCLDKIKPYDLTP